MRRVKPYAHLYPISSSYRVGRKNWMELQPRDPVTVQDRKNFSYEAVVDVLTEDCTVVWVLPLGRGDRRAFHCSDNVDIVLKPRGSRNREPVRTKRNR
jgi:hypothetical protein